MCALVKNETENASNKINAISFLCDGARIRMRKF